MPGPARPRAAGANVLTASTEDDPNSSARQRERRERILDATLTLASQGGFEGVQMRTVAELADVALGTLYRYFPSKVHLLAAAMAREFGLAAKRLQRAPIPGDTPVDRVLYTLGRSTRALRRDPRRTEAMTRAVLLADASAASTVTDAGQVIEQMLTSAMGSGEPTDEHRAIARVIGDVWMAGLVSWVTGRSSAEDVRNRLELAVRLLLGPLSER